MTVEKPRTDYTDFDAEVLIVGAGLAGLAAAILLAKASVRVVVLEKEKAPHHKVCGEFLSGECLQLLENLGVNLNLLGAQSISNFTLRSSHQMIHAKLPFTGMSLSRKALEEALIEQAERLGVSVRWNSRVSEYHHLSKNNGFVVSQPEGKLKSKALFWATGKHDVSMVQRRLGRENSSVGFKNHLRLPENLRASLRDSIELHLYRGGYAGLSLIEDGLVNYCCIIDKGVFKTLDGWDGLLKYQSEKNPRLQQILAAAQWERPKPLSIANIPYGFMADHQMLEKEVFFLGDQFAVIPSLAGDGMAIALLSAKIAVEHYLQSLPVEMYQKRMRSLVKSPVNVSFFLHKMFRSPTWASCGMTLLKPFPSLVEKLVQKTRSQCVPQTGC